MEFNPIALRKDKTLWSLILLPSEKTKLYLELNPIALRKDKNYGV